jgi:hypothetical protein
LWWTVCERFPGTTNGDITRKQAYELFFPFFDQDCLLPSAWRLVGAVNAACPTAGPFLPLQQFVKGSLNTTSARCWLFRVIDPANELISTERGQAFPKRKDFPIRLQCCLKIFTCFVDNALGKSFHHETSQAMPPESRVRQLRT